MGSEQSVQSGVTSLTISDDGSTLFRRAGDRILITCALIDTRDALQIWSQRLELEPAQAASAQDHEIGALVIELRRALFEAEIRRVDRLPGPGANAMEFVLYGQHLWRRNDNTPSGALEARKYFDQALKLDPDLVAALYWRGWTLLYELDLDPHADHDRLVRELDELSNRALGADRSDPDAWFIRAEALWRQWRAKGIARRAPGRTSNQLRFASDNAFRMMVEVPAANFSRELFRNVRTWPGRSRSSIIGIV